MGIRLRTQTPAKKNDPEPRHWYRQHAMSEKRYPFSMDITQLKYALAIAIVVAHEASRRMS
jgi:hypothetical protein